MKPIELLTDVEGTPKRIGQLILRPAPASPGRPLMAFRYDDDWRVHGFALGADLPLTGSIHYPVANDRGGSFGFVADHAPAPWVRAVCQKADLNGLKRPFCESEPEAPDLWTAMTSRPCAFSSLYSRLNRAFWGARNAESAPAFTPADTRSLARTLSRRLAALQTRPSQEDFDAFWRQACCTSPIPAFYCEDAKGTERSIRALPFADTLDAAMTAAVTASLALACGLDTVPNACLGSGLYAAARPDRSSKGEPLFCLSAASLIPPPSPRRPVCLLDVVDIVNREGARPTADLEQLFRRALFDALVGSRCTRPQDTWFTPESDGWRLLATDFVCPADVAAAEPLGLLPLTGASAAPDPEALVGASRYFGISTAKAKTLLMEFRHVLSGWKTHAKACGADFMTETQLRRLLER